MMSTDRKLRVAVLFGGRSGEHEVSLMSARSVLSVLDPYRYELVQIGITQEGKWVTGEDILGKFENGKVDGLQHVIVSPNPSEMGIYILQDETLKKLIDVDVFFPVLHGTFGEDGTIQGLFELADVAYVGAGVVGSSVGMDKGLFKDVMIANQIPVVEMMVVLRTEIENDMASVMERAEKVSEYPLFTKPAKNSFGATARGSTSSSTMAASFPPSSSVTRFSVPAALATTFLPVATEPVNIT